MNQRDEKDRQIEALQERLSRLSEASLRINESLEFDKVLQVVLDSARSLTGARYGVMTTLDGSMEVQDFLSSGMTSEETQRVWTIPKSREIFEYLRGVSGPLRVPDLVGHFNSIGLSGFYLPLEVGPMVSFMAAPVFHQGELLGNVFLAEKEEGAEFSRADEETMVMFASQAALAISNARRYREEQRARNDLETLVNTSPVGVVVFDARTGRPQLINTEATRISNLLRDPEDSPEQLMNTITYERADGQQYSLTELPIGKALSSAETIRAEEITLRVPNGRSVRVLLNATPIHGDEGQLASIVVTCQDMTSLHELERLRAEFLAMVSHELRTPLAAVKGSVDTLLETGSELDPAEMTQFYRIIRDQSDQMRYLIGDLLDVARIETGTLPVSPEPSELSVLVDEARGKYFSGSGREELHIELAPDLPWVLADRRRIVQVLGSLLTNAVRYSPDGSPIRLSAVRLGLYAAVCVADEGRGFAKEQLPQMFRRFSQVADVNREGGAEGSGLGLAISKGIVEAHGGRIWAESDGPGLGARFTFTIPAAEEERGESASSSTIGTNGPRNSTKGKVRILAVDDDPLALRYVRDALTRARYAPIVTGDPADVPRLLEEEKPHLVLLDLVFPGVDGIELMKDILRTFDVPIIFLSAYGQEDVIARAFDMGAVDYVVKPFSPTELTARIRAALRQRLAPYSGEPSEPHTEGGLSIDYSERRVTLEGQPVELTPTEYSLLYELSVNAGKILTHDALLHRIWGPEKVGEPWLVRDVVKRLRRKLGDGAESPRYILTEPRVGYRMAKLEAAETQ